MKWRENLIESDISRILSHKARKHIWMHRSDEHIISSITVTVVKDEAVFVGLYCKWCRLLLCYFQLRFFFFADMQNNKFPCKLILILFCLSIFRNRAKSGSHFCYLWKKGEEKRFWMTFLLTYIENMCSEFVISASPGKRTRL